MQDKQILVPKLLSDYPAPWHLTMDGVKSANGIWIMSATTPDLAQSIVDLANYAAILRDELAQIRAAFNEDGPA